VSNVGRYPKQVFWSDEDQGFIALAPDLPGSSAFGQSEQEALTELDEAIDAWIAAAESAGNPIPQPSRPAAEDRYSGKVLLRMPKSLHRELAVSAEMEGVSLNQHLVTTLRAGASVRSFDHFAKARISEAVAQAFAATVCAEPVRGTALRTFELGLQGTPTFQEWDLVPGNSSTFEVLPAFRARLLGR